MLQMRRVDLQLRQHARVGAGPDEAMTAPHRCPVCGGTGKVPDSLPTTQMVDCHACGGTGIVWEPEEVETGGSPTIYIRTPAEWHTTERNTS